MISIVLMLGTLFLLTSVIASYMVIKLPNKFWVKFLLIPLLLAIAYLNFTRLPEIMGYPFAGIPNGPFLVGDVRVMTDREGKQTITLEALGKDGARLYQIPYDGKILQQLLDAQNAERQGNGKPMEFKKKGTKDLEGGGNAYAYSLDGVRAPVIRALPEKPGSP